MFRLRRDIFCRGRTGGDGTGGSGVGDGRRGGGGGGAGATDGGSGGGGGRSGGGVSSGITIAAVLGLASLSSPLHNARHERLQRVPGHLPPVKMHSFADWIAAGRLGRTRVHTQVCGLATRRTHSRGEHGRRDLRDNGRVATDSDLEHRDVKASDDALVQPSHKSFLYRLVRFMNEPIASAQVRPCDSAAAFLA